MVELPDRVKDVDLSNVMQTSFLDYAMSVLVARALPDVRDGLKPVHPSDFIWDERTWALHPTSLIKNQPELLGKLWGNSTRMATRRFTNQWFGWRKILVTVTC